MATSPRMRIALRRGSLSELIPLQRKRKLQRFFLGQRAGAARGSLPDRIWLTSPQRLGPLGPCAGMELATQLGVERVIIEPRSLRTAKFAELLPLLGKSGIVRAAIEEVARGFGEQRQLAFFHFLKIHVAAAARQRGDAMVADPSPVAQKLQADERGVAGEGRGCGIRRVAVAGWTERQNLPDVLMGRGQEIRQTRARLDPGRRCRPRRARN